MKNRLILLLWLSLSGYSSLAQETSGAGFVTDKFGAIVRGDTLRKELALVLTGDEFADGGTMIRKSLRQNRVKASFFFTG
ncbi:MAG TPA: hypothetical protein VGD90_01080, partial [Sphingobacteriaceae bacterium]